MLKPKKSRKLRKSMTMETGQKLTEIKINSQNAKDFLGSSELISDSKNYRIPSIDAETLFDQNNKNLMAKKKLQPKYNLRRKSKKMTFLDFDLNLKNTEEKIKAYYRAKEDIADPERYNNEIKEQEEEILARDLGIDRELEANKYGFFIEMCLNARLPDGWSKELGKGHRMYYFNRKDGNYTFLHPCLNSFRKLMNNEYKKVLRSFSSGNTKGDAPKYINKCIFFN